MQVGKLSSYGWYAELFKPPQVVLEQTKTAKDAGTLVATAQALFYCHRLEELNELLEKIAGQGEEYRLFSCALRAQAALRSQKTNEAQQLLSSLQTEAGPLGAWARLLQAEILSQRGELQTAELLVQQSGSEPDLQRELVRAKILFRRGRVAEAAEVLLAATPIFEKAPLPMRAAAERNLAIFLGLAGDMPRSLMHHQRALGEFRALGDEFSLIKEYLSLGQTFLESSELDHARFFFGKAQESVERIGCAALQPLLHSRLGMLHFRRGEVEEAQACFQQDFEQSRADGNLFGQAFASRNLGRLQLRQKNAPAALAQLEYSAQLFRRLGDEFNFRLSQLEVAEALLLEELPESWQRAEDILSKCRDFFRQRGREDFLAQVGLAQSRLLVLRGQTDLAEEEFDRAARRLKERRRLDRLLEGEEALAEVLLKKGQRGGALEHLQRARLLALEAGQYRLAGALLERMGELDQNALLAFAAGRGREKQQITEEVFERFLLTSRSPQFEKVMEFARRVAETDETVLLLGETGTGKEMLARYLHFHSRRRGGPFLPLNCGAVADGLLEDEFFGHEKGAFTGALDQRMGIFESANGGTVFLDEIGDLSKRGQVVLLRVLEEKKVRPVGGNVFRAVDVRVIAATSHRLEEALAAGSFRRDLYYRLAAIVLEIPPLRERRPDIMLLAEFMLRRNPVAQQREIAGFTRQARELMQRHSWPGNLRQLENVIRSACLRCEERLIGVRELMPLLQQGCASAESLPTLAQCEREHIKKALALAGGSKTRAAKLLGIHRNTLINKIRQLDG